MNFTESNFELLKTGLEKLEVSANPEQLNLLKQYLIMLAKWNKIYNLTAIREFDQMVSMHILDSLSILPYLNSYKRILDVGSGAGLPGIPLAIFMPNSQLVLLDSNGKKTRFLTQAIIELGLPNVESINKRIENYRLEQKYQCIVTRAFATITNTIQQVSGVSDESTQYYFMKSQNIDEEVNELSGAFVIESIPLEIPGSDVRRTLVHLKKM